MSISVKGAYYENLTRLLGHMVNSRDESYLGIELDILVVWHHPALLLQGQLHADVGLGRHARDHRRLVLKAG